METKSVKYAIGIRVIFSSAHEENSRSGQEAEVVDYALTSDPSGLGHIIKFADGDEMTAYPGELTPIK
ncbi:MAG: hypothetical protein WDZ85_01510 [Candidatus Paceibacterota bacterium]